MGTPSGVTKASRCTWPKCWQPSKPRSTSSGSRSRDNKNIMKARRAVRKALELQHDGWVSPSSKFFRPAPPSGAKNRSRRASGCSKEWFRYFPLTVFRDRSQIRRPERRAVQRPAAEVLELAHEADTIACTPASSRREFDNQDCGFRRSGRVTARPIAGRERYARRP